MCTAQGHGSPLVISYLNILLDEIVVQDKTAIIRVIYAALAETMQKIKMGSLKQAPTYKPEWRARRDKSGHWEVAVILAKRMLSPIAVIKDV